MRVAGADDALILARSRFRAETDAAERQARVDSRRALIDCAHGRITHAEMCDAADVAAAHAIARRIRAVTQLTHACVKPPAL